MDNKKNRNLTEVEKELKEKTEKLRDEISKQEHELKQVQESCAHSKESLKFVPKNGSSSLMVTCDVCNKVLRYPTNNDLEENGYK